MQAKHGFSGKVRRERVMQARTAATIQEGAPIGTWRIGMRCKDWGAQGRGALLARSQEGEAVFRCDRLTGG